ncbi:putative efflux pump [Xylaria sp. FL1042]|nr:putative efflux pump [Xylaria sp. FL1042]
MRESTHLSMLTTSEIPPSVASQLQISSREPTLAPSASSMAGYEKEARSTLSSRDEVSSGSHSSTSSIVEGDAPAEQDVEKAGSLAKVQTARSQNGSPLQPTETREDGTEYPSGPKLILISVALCLSVFLTALDNSIIATAIPAIAKQFHSLDDVGWYGSAYLLTTAALQLLFGKFYTFLSIKWVYMSAIFIFEVGSLICGVAQNSVTLIIGRAVAGLGSAGLFSGALLILAHSVPLATRPLYTGLIGGVYGIASVAGPLLGGVFTDKVTWRWCFFINLPIGAVTLVVIGFFFPDPVQKKPIQETLTQRLMRFDPIGTLIFIPAIVSLLLALQWGGTTYPWNNGRIIALFVVFGVLLIAFLYIQWRQQENATVPPRIFRQRTVMAGSFFAFTVGSAFFLFVYYIPIWFQSVQGASAVNSGIRNLPLLLSVVVTSLISGGLITTFGYYTPFMIFGSVLGAVGGGLLTTWKPDVSSSIWIGYQIVFGIGVGAGLQQPLIAVQTVLGIDDVPIGTSVIAFMQTLGGALFVSVGNSVFNNKLVEELVEHVPSVKPQDIISVGSTNLQKVLPADILPGVILSYNNALTTAFIVSTALAAISIFGAVFVEWKSVKGKKIEAGFA